MKIFTCGGCEQTVYFHNVQCVRCKRRLGFAPDRLALLAFDEAADGMWQPAGAGADAGTYRMCANYVEHGACNWMVPADSPESLCRACRLNRTIPDLSVPRLRELWQRLQAEKNHLVYGLLRLDLPVISKHDDPDAGLVFDFLAEPDPQFREDGGVVTGHADGVITLDVAEADDAVRERLRQDMAEPYRTILGHFRHESGHYYWDRLVRDSAWLAEFRRLFGDDREPYADALARHYAQGPPAGWSRQFVSAYASSHPWEDWAESWAHYLHIIDTLETAFELGLRLAPRVDADAISADADSFDPIASDDFAALIDHWLPVTSALNTLNQSMGQGHVYPFVLAPPAIEKLELVHRIIRDGAGSTAQAVHPAGGR